MATRATGAARSSVSTSTYTGKSAGRCRSRRDWSLQSPSDRKDRRRAAASQRRDESRLSGGASAPGFRAAARCLHGASADDRRAIETRRRRPRRPCQGDVNGDQDRACRRAGGPNSPEPPGPAPRRAAQASRVNGQDSNDQFPPLKDRAALSHLRFRARDISSGDCPFGGPKRPKRRRFRTSLRCRVAFGEFQFLTSPQSWDGTDVLDR